MFDISLLKDSRILWEKLIPFGFIKEGEEYIYAEDILGGQLRLVIRISSEGGLRPPLTEQVANINEYDGIFVGSPGWWGIITPQVSSFLESSQLTGKTVIPFITHGGGGVMNTVKDLTAQCKGCEVSDKPWIGYGSRTAGVAAWIKGLGLSE